MGVKGLSVYRSRGWYHVHAVCRHSSAPEVLGLLVAAKISVGDPEEYKRWLERTHTILSEDRLRNKHCIECDGLRYNITRKQPGTRLSRGDFWIYEIDLDHEVFLGYDNYGHCSYSQTTPERHRYNWKSAPPAVEDSAIGGYTASERDSELSVAEAGLMMFSPLGHDIRHLEAIPDRSHIPDAFLSFGVEMIDIAVGRMLLGKQVPPKIPLTEFTWLASDICLYITTHLDDECNRKRDVLKLVDEIIRARPRWVAVGYGILFSVLPLRPCRSGSYQRIQMHVPLAVSTHSPIHSLVANFKTKRHGKLLLHRTITFLRISGISLRRISVPKICPPLQQIFGPKFTAAAEAVLRYPHIGDYRLVAVVPSDDEHSKPARKDKPNSKHGDPALVCRRFYAMLDGSLVPILRIRAVPPKVADETATYRLGYDAEDSGIVSFFSSSSKPFL
ncbi:hypothetical protein C8J57DRAFT_1707340 [Mycena rebaudengoi]|nr:hypothetical protein C8J57DRAFT_1707340 [Mycena rebaudengoi]